MTLNMLNGFSMIPRAFRPMTRRRLTSVVDVRILLSVGMVASIVALACDKVPLLAPTQSTITLTSSTTRAPLNSEVELIATVQEQSGSPVHDGTLVTFSTSLGTLAPSEVTTTRGAGRTKLQAGSQSGVATVNATSGSARTTGGTTTPTTPGGTPTTTPGTGVQIQ